MRIQIHPRFHLSLAFGMLFLLAGNHAIAESAYSRTPEHTAEMAQKIPAGGNLPLVLRPATPKYRTRRIVADPFLHRSWALVEDCRHPERPLQMVELPAGVPPSAVHINAPLPQPTTRPISSATVSSPIRSPQWLAASVTPSPSPQPARNLPASSAPVKPPAAMLVRAGDRVHLWSVQANVRLEIEVVALEYGHAGQVIHLRRVDRATGQGTTGAMLAGVVTGVDSAELLP